MEQNKQPYETPAIIYEGEITTRAGTAVPPCFEEERCVNPAKIFGP